MVKVVDTDMVFSYRVKLYKENLSESAEVF